MSQELSTKTNTPSPTENQTRQEMGKQHMPQGNHGRAYRPNVDVVELPEELLLVADLPGAKGDEIDIHFEDGELTVWGHVGERYANESKYLLREYGVGDFRRAFRVGNQIDATRISADFTDGVLRLHLPKIEAAKPRKISVKPSANG